MIVDLGGGSAVVNEPDILNRLFVVTPHEPDITDIILIDCGLAQSPTIDDASQGPWHVWLAIARLHELASQALEMPSASWEEDWAGMIRFAAENGWVSEAGDHVRAHIDRA